MSDFGKLQSLLIFGFNELFKSLTLFFVYGHSKINKGFETVSDDNLDE